MMLDLNKPIETRDGRKVEILRTDVKKDGYPLCGIVTNKDGSQYCCDWAIDGKLLSNSSDSDLTNVREEHIRWINIYEELEFGHSSKERADKDSGSGRLACIKVVWKEGEGLDV